MSAVASATNAAAPAIRTPGIRSSAPSPRRAAHCVHTVTVPAVSTASSSWANGAAPSSVNVAARPGTPNQDASPVSHSDTVTPDATAVAATVNACEQRSGSSAPTVTLTTRSRMPVSVRPRTTVATVLETVYTALLVLVALSVVWFAAAMVRRLYRDQD